MPIYEYRCQDCDHEFERMQKFSEPPVAACPTCTGSVQKLISRSTFHLKGDGWYVTDYARKSGTNGTSEKNDTSKSETSTESKTESKSDSSSSSTPSKTTSTASTASAASSTS